MNEKLIKFTLPSFDQNESPTEASSKARILVAEDDPVSRTLISSRLEKWGYNVVVTNDGAEAMAVLRGRDAPSLAILDWSMPGMDGLEICRRLREVETRVYIILLTAHGSKENIIEGLRARGLTIIWSSHSMRRIARAPSGRLARDDIAENAG